MLLNWDSQLRYRNRDNTDYYYDMWIGLMGRSQYNASTISTYDSEALTYRNDNNIATSEMKLPSTITSVIHSCIERGVMAYGNSSRRDKSRKTAGAVNEVRANEDMPSGYFDGEPEMDASDYFDEETEMDEDQEM